MWAVVGGFSLHVLLLSLPFSPDQKSCVIIYYSSAAAHTERIHLLFLQVSNLLVCDVWKDDSQQGSHYAEIQPSNRLVAGEFISLSLYSRQHHQPCLKKEV